MKKLLPFFLLGAITSATHAMELARITKPTPRELEQSSGDMFSGLAEYNLEQFEKGYYTHKNAMQYYLNEFNKSATAYDKERNIFPPELQSLFSIEEVITRKIHQKNYQTTQPNFTAEEYRNIQSKKETIGLGLMFLGMGCVFTKPLLGLCSLAGGFKLLRNSNGKLLNAENIIQQRKKAIQEMYTCIVPKQLSAN